jgi:hypothetical protein
MQAAMEEELTAASGAPQQGAGPLNGPPAPVPCLRWRREFPGEDRQLGVLRRWLESLLPDCPAREDVALVATELCTNAIQHTQSGRGGWFAVEITWHRSVVRVAVADRGAPAGPRMIDDPAGEHGRGLLVVAGLSARTGVCGGPAGRMVWADVPWGDAGAAESASSQDEYEAVIGDGLVGLASRFAGVPAWFGRSTLLWWALAGGQLVAASSASELAGLLGRVLDQPPGPPAAMERAGEDAGMARIAGRGHRTGSPGPPLLSGSTVLPGDGEGRIGLGEHGRPATLAGGHGPGVSARRTVTVAGRPVGDPAPLACGTGGPG